MIREIINIIKKILLIVPPAFMAAALAIRCGNLMLIKTSAFNFVVITISLVIMYIIVFRNLDILSPVFVFSGVYCFIFAIGGLSGGKYIDENYYYIMCIIGYISAYIGMMIVEFFSKLRSEEEKPKRLIIRWDNKKVYYIGLILFAITFFFYLIYVKKVGIAILSSDIDASRSAAINGNVSGFLSAFAIYAYYVVPLLYFPLFFDKDFKKKREILIVFILSILFLIGTGVRSTVFMIIFCCLNIYNYRVKKVKFGRLSVVGVILVSFISIIQIIRFGMEINLTNILERFFEEFAAVSFNLNLILKSYNPDDYLYGMTSLMSTLVLLPGDYKDISMYLKDYFKLDFQGGGLTPSILGGFYIDYGVLGIVIGMLCYGFIYQAIYRWFRRRKTIYRTTMYAMISIYMLLCIRNGFMYGIISFSQILFVIFINVFLVKRGSYE